MFIINGRNHGRERNSETVDNENVQLARVDNILSKIQLLLLIRYTIP
jgi:hypothetical protein